MCGEFQITPEFPRLKTDTFMRHLIILIVHLIATVLRVARPLGVRAVVADILTKHQLLILNRSRQRAPEPLHPGSPHCGILLALDYAQAVSGGGHRL